MGAHVFTGAYVFSILQRQTSLLLTKCTNTIQTYHIKEIRQACTSYKTFTTKDCTNYSNNVSIAFMHFLHFPIGYNRHVLDQIGVVQIYYPDNASKRLAHIMFHIKMENYTYGSIVC